MLTGDEVRTFGDASVLDRALSGQKRKFLEHIGYCPQFDSIIEVLTGKEMLTLFARLRGVPKDVESLEVEKWVKFMGKKKKEAKCKL